MKKTNWWQVLTGGIAGIVLMFLGIKTDVINIGQSNDTDSTHIDSTIVKPSAILYGLNGNVEYVPLTYENSMLANAIRGLGIQCIRIPGGTNANDWNWERDTVHNSLYKISQLVKGTDIQVLFVLNISTKDIDNQIRMLHVAQDSFHIPIKMVEAGNELNLKDKLENGKYHTATEYANAVKELTEKVHAEFPGCLVGAVGGNKRTSASRHWNEEILSVFTPDAFVEHLYASTDSFAVNGIGDTAKLRSDILRQIAEDDINNVHGVPVWITEYNWDLNDKEGTNFLSEESQYAATYYMTVNLPKMINNVRVMCLNNVVNNAANSKMGAFAVSKKDVTIQPTGQAIKDFLNNNK